MLLWTNGVIDPSVVYMFPLCLGSFYGYGFGVLFLSGLSSGVVLFLFLNGAHSAKF